MNNKFTFKDLGLHKVKDVDENKLRNVYKDFEAHPLKYITPQVNIDTLPMVDLKQLYRNKIIETAKAM